MSDASVAPSADGSKIARFGTFEGVFTPNVLTILGVIMFLRFGQIVGQAGLTDAIIIVLCAKLITSLTAVSLAGVATNTRVKGGGAYFLISRSLGPEFGGAIGVVFFLAQAISVAMYVIGFTEAFTHAFPASEQYRTLIATTVNVVVFLCVFVGAGWTIKVQFGILAVLGLSLLSFYIGAAFHFSPATAHANLHGGYTPGQNVFTMFALFFPAATGIMAGANMSGDLKDPDRSLPIGTFGAIAVTGLIYLSLVFLLSGVAPREELIANNFIMKDVALVSVLIVLGVFAATLSSALGSMMGAPRILQALAKDEIFPAIRWLSRGSGATNEPRYATAVTFMIAQAAIMVADLDLIAPIVTMFFMVTYGMLNLACFYEGYSQNPSFRPRFRLSHWSISLAGAIGCGVAMLLMAPLWAVVAVGAMWAVYRYIGRAEVHARFGDVLSGVALQQARRALLRLEEETYHPKNWRPMILALSGGVWNRYHLAEYGYWLAAGRGLLTFAQVASGELEDRIQLHERHQRRLRQFIQEEDLDAFPAVVIDKDLIEGVKSLLQCYGIGGLRPNTVMLGWSEDPARVEEIGRILRLLRDFRRNIVIVKCEEVRERWVAPAGTIDVWWHSRENGPLMVLLAHMLLQNREFQGRRMRILNVVAEKSASPGVTKHLTRLLQRARIDADVEVIVSDDIVGEIRKRSRKAAVVFMGFDPPQAGSGKVFSDNYFRVMEHLDTVVLVHSVGEVDLEA
jgi:amino acid transporter